MANSRGWRVKSATAPKASAQVDAQEVARVAYSLYVQRGCVDGHDFEDWLRAEEIVRRRRISR